jgi:hypothetical protein
MRPQEWTRYGGATNAPGAQEEAELLELGRRVPWSAATSRSCSTTPPTTPEQAGGERS